MNQSIVIAEPIAHAKVTLANILMLLLCAFVLMIDGFDIYLVGNLGPAIAAHFKTTPAHLSLVFLLQQSGLAVGAFVISPIADRFGRRNVLLCCATAFALLTLAAPFAGSLLQFAVLRALAAIFLSGPIPSAIAMLVGATPRGRRSLFVSIAFTGYGTGAVGGAMVGALLLKHYGWQSGFWIGGIVPLVYVLIAARLLPRSADLPDAAEGVEAPVARTSRLSAIFADGRKAQTVLLWAVFFLATGTVGLMLSWMPTFFSVRGGISLPVYSSVASFALTGSLIGTLTIGFALDRFPPVRVVAIAFALMFTAIELLSRASFGTTAFTLSFMILAIFQGAGQTALSAIAAQFYPSAIRATGIGWAFGAGRVGGILGPTLGGAMLAANFSLVQFFQALAAPIIACVVLLILLDLVRARLAMQDATPASHGDTARVHCVSDSRAIE